MRCRICGTASNLKYTPQELRKITQSKKNTKDISRFPYSALPPLTGNICWECDERLHNFHKFEDGDSDDIVDVESDDNFYGNKRRLNQLPKRTDNEQRVIDRFYQNSTLAPQSHISIQQTASLGSDGDAEVIEVLTSRETTPDVMRNDFNKNENITTATIPTNAPIVDIIDLENYDDLGRELQKTTFDYNQSESFTEKETRFLGCLNLISSDSESEINFEPCTTKTGSISSANTIVECPNNIKINSKNTSVPIQHSFPVCAICGIYTIDNQTLQTHMLKHETNKCILCKQTFSIPLELIYHMRQKHRSYDGDALCEGARCSQDSAMTIRLRFFQRFIYYECQLCGVIDSEFKTHKTHIMQKHADESKSLRDPMMKPQQKCPCCKQNCGTQHVDICRHLLTKHNPIEYNEHLKEVINLEEMGHHMKSLEKVQHATRILMLGGFKQRFFECQLCLKVFGSPNSFLKHLNGHNIDEWNQYKERKSKKNNDAVTMKGDKEITRKRKIKTRNKMKSETIQNDIVVIIQKEKVDETSITKKSKLEYNIPIKTNNKLKKSQQPKDIKIKATEVITKSNNKLPITQSQITILPNNNMKFNSTIEVNKRQKKLTRKAIKKEKINKSTENQSTKPPIKVKVKPPLRHFPTQKYNCKYCQTNFKGFRKLQLHMLNVHRSDEFRSCDSCTYTFMTQSALNQHQCHRGYGNTFAFHSKRKHNNNNNKITNKENDLKNGNSDDMVVDENFNNNECKQREYQMQSEIEVLQSPKWLKDLFELSRKKENELNYLNTANEKDLEKNATNFEHNEFDSSERTVCFYCGQLFKKPEDALAHEQAHSINKDMPWIHFNPLIEKPINP